MTPRDAPSETTRQHSPTPWRVVEIHGRTYIGRADESFIAEVYRSTSPQPRANAAYIVHCVNHMDEALGLMRGLVHYRHAAGPLNFQLEKADDFIGAMAVFLDEAEHD